MTIPDENIFFDLPTSQEAQPVGTTRSLLGAFPRGVLETWNTLLKIFERDPEATPVRQLLKERPEVYEKEGIAGVLREAFPEKPITERLIPEAIEKALPIQKDEPLSEFLRKFGGIAAVPMPGLSLPQFLARGGAAAVSSSLAKQLGAGPLTQALAEVPAWMATPAFGRRIIPPKGLESTFEAIERMGLSPETIAVSTQPRRRAATLSKFASKSAKAEERFSQAGQELSEFYETMRESPAAAEPIHRDLLEGLVREWTPIIEDIPFEHRKLIANDVRQFIESEGTGNDLMRFWKQLNQIYPNKKGRDFQHLKGAMETVLNAHNPELGETFSIWNNLYSHFANLKGKLAPQAFDSFSSALEKIELAKAVAAGDKNKIINLLGYLGIRKIPEHLLISPRLQNLSGQMLRAAKTGSPKAIERVGEALDAGLREGMSQSYVLEPWDPEQD